MDAENEVYQIKPVNCPFHCLMFTDKFAATAMNGPKIDLKICGAIGRTWQCLTVQCDFNLCRSSSTWST